MYRSRICALVYQPYSAVYIQGAISGGKRSPLSCLRRLFRNMAIDEFSSLMLISFSSLALFLRPASSAVIHQPSSSFLNLDSSSLFDCVSLRNWIGNNYVASDCHQAIRRFVREEVSVHMDHELEFLAPGSSPLHALPTVETPRRYTVGSSFSHFLCNTSAMLFILTLSRELQSRDCHVQLVLLPGRLYSHSPHYQKLLSNRHE